jgi:cobalt-zinc-cadmium efflux system protein
MVSDVGALTVALIAARVRHHRPNDGYTFGLRRAPVLGGLVNGVALVVVVALIGVEAAERFAAPPTLAGEGLLVTGVAGLAVNLGSAWYLARSRDRSVNTRGAMMHLLADALGSVAAIVSGVAVMVWAAPLADPIAGVVIGVLILIGSLPLLRDTVRILLQRAPVGIDVTELRRTLEQDPAVRSIHDLHVWELDSGEPVLSAVALVEVESLDGANEVADRLRARLHDRFAIEHATFECRGRDAPECAM